MLGTDGLVLWLRPERGLIMPSNFSSLAEETGQILGVRELVIRAAYGQIKAQNDDLLLDLVVNISPAQFSQGDFALLVESILADSGTDPRLLKLEFTVGVLLESAETAGEKMEILSKLDIRFSIYDFSTGYSLLACLK